jgi:hypothetical protein
MTSWDCAGLAPPPVAVTDDSFASLSPLGPNPSVHIAECDKVPVTGQGHDAGLKAIPHPLREIATQSSLSATP